MRFMKVPMRFGPSTMVTLPLFDQTATRWPSSMVLEKSIFLQARGVNAMKSAKSERRE